MNNDLKIVFFGTPQVAVYVLEELKKAGIMPTLIVTAPDKPSGRKLVVTPPPAKIWGEENFISVFQPKTLRDATAVQAIKDEGCWDLFIVAAYGNILTKEILGIPKYGTLNVHPSFLPRLRGASPIQTAILENGETGVTIMLVDEEMDHGSIVAQEKVDIANWPPKASELEETLMRRGGQILAEIIPLWTTGKIKTQEQDHSKATFTKKITKEDGLLNLNDDAEKNYRKIQAFDIWPRAYFFAEKKGKRIRVIITDATLENDNLVIKKIIPEGKKEMLYVDFRAKGTF
ncbi:Methionyl-tRNA formyltransferase [hydrothermal vent metagenome]|uniref:methionyl-tRNA formyltransferase n=1 Tax=hydrothermal vent metagenome TaxID=652676 RepID=A0A3B0TRV9_9ZZZZ